jgi:hypothetical protein
VGFVCEWPAAGIPLSRQELDAQMLLDAAARARALFPTEPTSQSGATWSSLIASPQPRADDPAE